MKRSIYAIVGITIFAPMSLSADFFKRAEHYFTHPKQTLDKAGKEIKKDISKAEHARRASDMLTYAELGGPSGKSGIKNLLDIGTSVDIRGGKGQTALMVAAKSLHADLVKFLLKKGANPKAKDKDGATAIDYANNPNVWTMVGKWKQRKANIIARIMRAQEK